MAASGVLFFRLKNEDEDRLFRDLLSAQVGLRCIDKIREQVRELIRIEQPSRIWSDGELERAAEERLGVTPDQYGCWVYYPWLHAVIHLLDEEEFFRVRSARNMYKITPEEQALLKSKKIGVIGLSVGHAVVMSLVMEGIGGELRLADFDTLDLSNCNRIQASLMHLGIPKTEMAMRTIAEINPFLNVKVFSQGVTEQNIDAFFTDGGLIDIVIEECDSLEIKLLSRIKAKEYRIPLIMETSDRGLLDVERYDTTIDLPLLHGLLSAEFYKANLSVEEKRSLFTKMIDFAQLSERAVYSMSEMGKTITTWPQLASDVLSGGATVSMTVRMILLGENIESKRVYVDIPSSIRGIA
jgi:hypothetical protein